MHDIIHNILYVFLLLGVDRARRLLGLASVCTSCAVPPIERGDGRGVNLARRGLDGLEPVRKLTSESTWRRVEGVEVMTTI